MEVALFLKLLLAHLLGQFLIQPKKWVQAKKVHSIRTPYFWLHIVIQSVLSYVLVGDWRDWRIPLVLFMSNGLIDFIKIKAHTWQPKIPELWIFSVDQVVHVLVLMALSSTAGTGFWVNAIAEITSKEALLVIVSFFLVSSPSGIVISLITSKLSQQVPLNEGLERAGRLIGVLERILVLIFILFDQFSAIGLLLASKSILRISREDDKEARTKTEYVLVGTLLSFLAATAVGIVAKTLI
jgi:hypothetical protein